MVLGYEAVFSKGSVFSLPSWNINSHKSQNLLMLCTSCNCFPLVPYGSEENLIKASLCLQRFHLRLQKSNMGLGNLAKDLPISRSLCLIHRMLLVQICVVFLKKITWGGCQDPKWAEGEKESRKFLWKLKSLSICVFSMPGHSLFTWQDTHHRRRHPVWAFPEDWTQAPCLKSQLCLRFYRKL